MRPHPRLRRFALWGGASTTAALLVLWGVSGWWLINYNGLPWVIVVSHGTVSFIPSHPGAKFLQPGWHAMRLSLVEFPRNWFLAAAVVSDLGVLIHCGLLALPFAGVAGAAWRLEIIARHRERIGLCPRCNYNRAGLAPTAVCPECGTAPRASAEPV